MLRERHTSDEQDCVWFNVDKECGRKEDEVLLLTPITRKDSLAKLLIQTLSCHEPFEL